MKRKKWTLSEKVLWLSPILFLLVVSAGLYAPHTSRPLEALAENWGITTTGQKQRSICISNLKQMSLAVSMYCSDYDEHYPLASTPSADVGWGGLITPYLMAPPYQCPRNPRATSPNGISLLRPTSTAYTNYYYNARLSNADPSQMGDPSRIILFGEGTSSNARYSKTHLPPQWVSDSNSPARIHYEPGKATGGNANYAFADGHVNRAEPQFIGSGPISAGKWTFSLR